MLIALALLLVLLVVVPLGIVLGMKAFVNSSLRHIPVDLDAQSAHVVQRAEAAQSGGQPENWLIMGSDSRLDGGDPTNWQYGAQRSDVTMLVNFAGDGKHITVMSVPRDSWVDIPGHGTAKINAAYS